EILAQEGEVVAVGKPIAIISTGGDSDSPAAAPATTAAPAPTQTASAPAIASAPAASSAAKLDKPAEGRFYSPLVMNLAREEGISMQELEYIPGTGKEGRVSKKDILDYVANRGAAQVNGAASAQASQAAPAQAAPAAAPAPQAAPTPAASFSGDVEIIEMDR